MVKAQACKSRLVAFLFPHLDERLGEQLRGDQVRLHDHDRIFPVAGLLEIEQAILHPPQPF